MVNLKTSLKFALALGMLQSNIAHGQEDFPPPPPPPDFGDMPDNTLQAPQDPINNFNSPPPASNLGGSGRGTPVTTGSVRGNSEEKYKIPGRDKTKPQILDKNQKNKFNNAGPEDIAADQFPETIESFDFPNVDIQDIIKAISELTGKNFIIEPSVRGKITIIAPSKITVAEAYKAFLSSLAINGFTVVPSGSFLKIKSARSATRDNIETYSGAYYPNTDQMITRIVHLKFISAETVNRELRMFTSKDGEMNIYSQTNSIIISDYGTSIDRFMKVLSQLDVPGFEEQLLVIRVKYAKAKDMADLIDKIINKGQRSNSGAGGAPGSFSAGVPRFTRGTGAAGGNQQGGSSYFAIPEDRTNSIIVTGTKAGIDRVRKLVAQLDQKIADGESGGVNVYYVKYGEAKKIAQTLQNVTKDSTARPQAAPSPFAPIGPAGFGSQQQEIFGGDVKISADETTNSLVITASKQDYETVLGILRKIDIPRDQVFVEAIIMEISQNDNLDWGIGYFKYGEKGYGKTGFNGGVNIQDMLNPTSGTGAILGFASGDTVEYTPPTGGTPIKIPSLAGFITLLKKNAKTNILSTPQVTALDNQEALIEVGDKVATGTQQTAGTNGAAATVTPTFEEATIALKLKPFINPTSNAIRMEIDQSVKQPVQASVAPKSLQDSTLQLATRKIKTNIVVNNGDTAVLGGLVRDRETVTEQKVPFLGDIPVLGWLFKSKSRVNEKVNLMVFLTPKIIRADGDSRRILDEKLEERREFLKNQGGIDPFGAKIDKMTRTNSVPDPGVNSNSSEQEQPEEIQ